MSLSKGKGIDSLNILRYDKSGLKSTAFVDNLCAAKRKDRFLGVRGGGG